MEKAPNPMGFPSKWPPGPKREAMPDWARAGKIRFARWDGGRIETAKAFLSGWPGFNPPSPDFVESMTNWYTPRTVELLREAGINTIWVTFSNGFSIQSERAHMEQLKTYIAECHRAGIHVFAYQSIANLFWEDMFENVPESKDWVRMGADGKPTPYGAASYAKMGRTTRYMARIPHPGWQEYLRKRVDLALDAGADGIFYDNNFNEALPETYQSVYQWASSRKRDVLLMGNFHESSYVLNRLTNALSTEDGLEPGVYAARNVTGRLEKIRDTLASGDGGYLVNNIGLYRLHEGLSDGWKPVMIEHGHRETGDRFSNPISGPRHQLALAEAAACGAAFQVFSEGAFADGLWRGRPGAMDKWQAIARYNRFLRDNEALYVNTEPTARVAVVVDERAPAVGPLNSLAARNVQFEVFWESDAKPVRLQRYARVVKQAAALQTADLPAVVKLDAPAGVLHTVRTQPAGKRLLIHLLNYTGREQTGVEVTVPGRCGTVALVSPDAARHGGHTARDSGGACVVEVPRLVTYAVVIFEGKEF
jgi:hypothetical protein